MTPENFLTGVAIGLGLASLVNAFVYLAERGRVALKFRREDVALLRCVISEFEEDYREEWARYERLGMSESRKADLAEMNAELEALHDLADRIEEYT